jgi:hypothetical protein
MPDPEETPLPAVSMKQRVRQWSLLVGTAATILTAVSAHFQPETVAKETAGAAAEAIQEVQSKYDRDLGAAVATCQKTAAEGVIQAKAEADAVRELVLGYMLGLQQRGGVQVGGADMRKALDRVVDQLGETKAKALNPVLQEARDGFGAAGVAAGANAPPPPAAAAPAPKEKASYRLEQLSK